MRNLRKILAGIVAFVTLAASAAYALTIPPTFAPRYFATQQTHYLRYVFNFNSCVIVSNVCGVKVGAVPYNSFLKSVYIDGITSFNSGTTDTIALGTAQTSATVAVNEATILASQSVHNIAGPTLFCGQTCGSGTFAGIGINATGQGTSPTGTSGGFDIWANYKSTGSAPTQGQYIGVIEFIAPNDGVCVPTPIDSTGAAGFTLQTVC